VVLIRGPRGPFFGPFIFLAYFKYAGFEKWSEMAAQRLRRDLEIIKNKLKIFVDNVDDTCILKA